MMKRRFVGSLMVVAVIGSMVAATGWSKAASAASAPSLLVSPSAGPVGSVVTVTSKAPPNAGCGFVEFESPGFTHPTTVPAGSSNGGARFVIPSFSGGNYEPVMPGVWQFSMACDASNIASQAITVSTPFRVTSSVLPPSRFVGMAATPHGSGYWLAQAGGGVFSYGDARYFGSLPGLHLVPDAPIVGIAATPDGGGYWLAGADGGVFAFGDARFFGSLPSFHITPSAPIVAITADPLTQGYWLVGADGGVFAFGGSKYRGSTSAPGNPAKSLAPVVGLGCTANGTGYYEAGSLGGGWGSGDIRSDDNGFLGFADIPLAAPVTGIAVNGNGSAAWEVAADGGVFNLSAFVGSNTPFFGSLPGDKVVPAAPIVTITIVPGYHGYWLLGADGGVFTFGAAHFYGSAATYGLPWTSG